jgi:hypothetical protein
MRHSDDVPAPSDFTLPDVHLGKAREERIRSFVCYANKGMETSFFYAEYPIRFNCLKKEHYQNHIMGV